MRRFFIKWCIFFCIIFGVTLSYIRFVSDDISGDLGVLGRIPFTTEYDIRIRTFDYSDNLMTKLVDIDSASVYPVLLIGDSFTEPDKAFGHCISKALGDTVPVVCTLKDRTTFAPTEVFLYGLKNNCFSKGQTIILESIGRGVQDRFARLDYSNKEKPANMVLTWEQRESQKTRLEQMAVRRDKAINYDVFTLNNMLTWIRTRLGYKQPVAREKLVRKMFDHEKYGDDLFYYKDDIVNCDVPQDMLHEVAEGVNTMFRMSDSCGVRLYLMLTPDKYDLYYPYIQTPRHSKPNMMEFIKEVDDKYKERIINTCDTLRPYLSRGELDIISCSDSHWSVYAAEEMARNIGGKLLRDGVFIGGNKGKEGE